MADENPNMTNVDLVGLSPARSDLLKGTISVSVKRKRTCKNGDAREDNLVQQQGSLFYCSICLDLAKDPVVTCCDHLFCWLCMYRWLNHHSSANQCPVCKGEVTVPNVTPIYGRESDNNINEADDDTTKDIPLRPQARGNESARRDSPLTTVDFDLTNVHLGSNRFNGLLDVSILDVPNRGTGIFFDENGFDASSYIRRLRNASDISG